MDEGFEQGAHARVEGGLVGLRALGVPLDADDPAVPFALHTFDEIEAVLVGERGRAEAGREVFEAHGLVVARVDAHRRVPEDRREPGSMPRSSCQRDG